MFHIYLSCLAAITVYQTVWFLVALLKKKNSIADISWGLGFILVAFVSVFIANNWNVKSLVITTLVTVWGLRLATHILIRNWGRAEDPRYKKWREEWGDGWILRSFLQVFVLQGFILTVISIPVMWVAYLGDGFGTFQDYIGLAIWVLGFFFESVGDYQLLMFKRKNSQKGLVMKTGLWRYTRHPNYFGEAAMWWGIWVMAVSVGADLWRFATIVGPITITFLLLKVSGVTLTEQRFEGSKEYIEYQKKTSAFIPQLPKK